MSFSRKKFNYLKIPTEQIITFKNEFFFPLYPWKDVGCWLEINACSLNERFHN